MIRGDHCGVKREHQFCEYVLSVLGVFGLWGSGSGFHPSLLTAPVSI